MQPWIISWIVFCAVGMVFPATLLVYTWRRDQRVTAPVIVPLIAIVILALALIHDIRWVILGPDYSRRLYTTIGIFIVLTLINAIYAAIRRAWTVAIASTVVSMAWFFVGVVNSVV